MKKHLGKALALAVMMSVLAGGSAYAEGTKDDEQDMMIKAIYNYVVPDQSGTVTYRLNELEAKKVSARYVDPLDGYFVNSTQTASNAIMALDTALAKLTNGNNVTGTNSTAVGHQNTVSGNNSGAFGDPTTVSGDRSYSVGNNNNIDTDDTFVLGSNVKNTTKGSVILGVDSEATEDNVVSVGAEGSERKIVNVAEGENDTDAVNKKQMEEAIAAAGIGGASSEALEKLDNKINQTNDRVDRVGATAAALAGIHYQPMSKGQSQVAVGMGGYKGKKATALGLAYQITDRVSGSVAGAANGSERMFNVGFNYLFGQHSDKDVAQCAAVPGSVSLKEAEMQATIDSQGAKINTLESEIAELKAMVKALAAKQ